MIELVLSIALTVYGAIAEPSRATCPSPYVIGGVSPDGWFRCVHDLVGSEHAPLSFRPPGQVTARVYCEAGRIPIMVDERTVACAKGRYQW